MFPRIPMVLVDRKALGAGDVRAVVVKTTLAHVDMAEVTVASPRQGPPPTYRIGGNLEVKLALGDSIFAGRIVGLAPNAGLQHWVIRAFGPMQGAQPPRKGDARIAQPIKKLAMSLTHPVFPGNPAIARAELVLDPEVDSIKFLLGDTKEVSAGPGRSFTGNIENIERRYGQDGGDRLTLNILGLIPESSAR